MLKAVAAFFQQIQQLLVGSTVTQQRTLSVGGSVMVERYGATPHVAMRGGTNSTIGYEYRINVTQTDASVGVGVIGGSQSVAWKWYPNYDYEVVFGDVVIGTAGKGLKFDSGLIWRTGAGTPEGVVTAPVGSLFTRTDGGANTTLYVKESGAGNTGWVAK